MTEEEDSDEGSSVAVRTQTSVRVKPPYYYGKSVHCNGCNKHFSTEDDDYFDHVYGDDKCYRAYLASDRREMGKE